MFLVLGLLTSKLALETFIQKDPAQIKAWENNKDFRGGRLQGLQNWGGAGGPVAHPPFFAKAIDINI